MASFFQTVTKSYSGAGRNQDLIYINVITSARAFSGTFQELLLLPPWNDPAFAEFIIEISETEFQDIQSGIVTLFHDGLVNLPKFQRNVTLNETGSWVDPTDDTSTWQVGVVIPDDREILNMFNGNPQGAGVHIASIDLEENEGGQSLVRIDMRLFDSNGTQSTSDEQGVRLNIGGKLFTFDFTNGDTNFDIDTSAVGIATFASNHAFRVVGPGGEKQFISNVFGRTLRASQD